MRIYGVFPTMGTSGFIEGPQIEPETPSRVSATERPPKGICPDEAFRSVMPTMMTMSARSFRVRATRGWQGSYEHPFMFWRDKLIEPWVREVSLASR